MSKLTDRLREIAEAESNPPVDSVTETAPSTRPTLLASRAKTHGSFGDNAYVSQRIKETMRKMPGWHDLTDIQREALDMDAAKTGRILGGNARAVDHWADKIGYAQLALEEIEPNG